MDAQTHDWIQHDIGLTRAVLAMKPRALNKLYTPAQIEYERWLHAAKVRAYRDLQAGQAMDALTQAVADYLLAYAEAHVRHWQKNCAAAREAVRAAGVRLEADYTNARRGERVNR